MTWLTTVVLNQPSIHPFLRNATFNIRKIQQYSQNLSGAISYSNHPDADGCAQKTTQVKAKVAYTILARGWGPGDDRRPGQSARRSAKRLPSTHWCTASQKCDAITNPMRKKHHSMSHFSHQRSLATELATFYLENKLCGRPPQYAPAPCKLTFDL